MENGPGTNFFDFDDINVSAKLEEIILNFKSQRTYFKHIRLVGHNIICLCHGFLLSVIDPGPARDQINKLWTMVLVLMVLRIS